MISSFLSYFTNSPLDTKFPSLEPPPIETKVQQVASSKINNFGLKLNQTLAMGLVILGGITIVQGATLSDRVDRYCENSCAAQHLFHGINADGSPSLLINVSKFFVNPLFYACAHRCESLFRDWCLTSLGFNQIENICEISSKLQYLELHLINNTPYLTYDPSENLSTHAFKCFADAQDYCLQMNQHEYCIL